MPPKRVPIRAGFPAILRFVCSAIVLLMSLLFIGCDYVDKNTNTNPAPQPSTPPTQAAVPVKIPVQQIELFDASMRRSNQIALSGDLRPYWIVSGHIRNNSGEYLSDLQLRVYIHVRGSTEAQDEANLHIETDISPGSVGSFSREIQILPPQKAWDWSYEVVEARAKSH